MAEQSSPSKRAPSKRSGSQRSASQRSESQRSRQPSPAEVAGRAGEQLGELVGRMPEAVVSLERSDDGWTVGVEVVETHRIPDTADVIAVYEVDVDPGGTLRGYRRARRYQRGRTLDES